MISIEQIYRVKEWTEKATRSIRASLVMWFLLLSILPFIAISWYAYVKTVQSSEEMQRNKLQDTALLNVNTLKERFYETDRDLSSWSSLQGPQSLFKAVSEGWKESGKSLQSFVKSGEYKAIVASHSKTLEKVAHHYDYVYDLLLIDLEGNILYTVAGEEELGSNLHSGAYANTLFAKAYRKTLRDGKPYFSDLEKYAPSRGKMAGFITRPLMDGSGKTIGVIAMQLNMDKLFGSLGRNLNQSNIRHYLVGADGLLRTPINNQDEVLKRRINTEIFWSWYDEHGIFDTKTDDMFENATSYTGPNGAEVLGQHHSIDLLGIRWAHISEIGEEKLMAEPLRLAKTIAAFTLIMILMVILTAIVISRRLMHPIKKLSEVSMRYMNGEKGIRVEVDTNNEMGDFGKVFNKLIETQEYNEEKLVFLANKAEAALEELKEQKFALDAHAIVTMTDVKGTIRYVNHKFEEISGYSSDELIGANHRIVESGIHPKTFWTKMYHAVSHGEVWHDEVCNRAKDGHLYWVDTTIVPFMGEDGKPEKYIAIRSDISTRKKAEESLSEALSLQKALFENAGVSIITTDCSGVITSMNLAAETMLGYKSDEMVGRQTPAIIHKLDEVVRRAEEFSKEIGEAIPPGFRVFVEKADRNLPNTHEWTYVRKDGSELPIYLTVTALRDAYENIYGYMGIASDISMLKEAEQQMILAKEAAEASARVKSEFLATMSHEIRTPMNGVLGMLGLLSHSNLDETQRHQIRIASNSANSLLGLINDILDFSKVEAGKMELEMIEFNLRDELGEFVEAIAFRAQEKGLELILDTTQLSRTSVITDPGRLRQILTNLVGNAVKFTHRGEILIRAMLDETDESHGRLRIDVSDTGIGIAADKIGTLFESFSQADNSTTRKYGGTGLGLAIVKRLCELMDGSIWITSKEHEGSTFHIDIAVGLGERSSLSIPSVSVAGKSVLVVDDNETNRAVVRAQLELWGMEVYEAEDPIIAFDMCQIRISQGHIPPYEVALLDMQMPNMDGADLGSEVRKITQCDAMKMVMMTSLGSRNDAKRFAEIGFDAFFAKPTTTKDLLNALKVLFDEGAALEGADPLVTKDYLHTLQEQSSEIIWPSATRLLLVEDNPTNQIVALGMLEMIGLNADIANNGLEALEAMQLALETEPYTAILMDCQMPEMDGYEASTAIREGGAGDGYKNVPIIAMTANAMAGDREKCLLSGMSDYITKPISLSTLRTALLRWLQGAVSEETGTKEKRAAVTAPEETNQPKVWDEADALNRLGGKKELLAKIIQSFRSDSPRMMKALEEAIANEDLSAAQLHAHSIKGSAGNISAQQVQMLAKTMEFAAKNGEKEILREGYANLEKAMREVCALFDKELSVEAKPTKSKKRVDPLKMAIMLQNLKKEIQAGSFIDTESLGLFGEYADDAFTERMSALKGHIDRFESAEAIALLEIIMEKLE